MAANGADQLSLLIADIYAAAADSSRWPTALKRLCRYIPGAKPMCWSRRAPSRQVGEVVSTGDFAPALRFRDVRFSKQPPRV